MSRNEKRREVFKKDEESSKRSKTAMDIISVETYSQITKINTSRLIANARSLNELVNMRKMSTKLKKTCCERVIEVLNAGSFFQLNSKEECVNDLIVSFLTPMINQIKRDHSGIELYFDRKMPVYSNFNEFSQEVNIFVGEVEQYVYSKKIEDEVAEPIIYIKAKRRELQVERGLTQNLLALHGLKDYRTNQDKPVFGILCNGLSFRAIKYGGLEDIKVSKLEDFCNRCYQIDNKAELNEFREECTQMIDTIYSVILEMLDL